MKTKRPARTASG
ncbi:hypothetical protein GQ600_20040 [Phytophthora cactorum]|nr:hypothetical protein GQ600_20040 [Phytophthora cactorum]